MARRHDETAVAVDEPPLPPDIDRLLGAKRRNLWIVVVVAVVLFVAGVGVGVVVDARMTYLDDHGFAVPGEVTATHGRDSGSVRVRYDWDGRSRSSLVHSSDFGSRYYVGEEVMMLVDPKRPSRVTIAGETNQHPLTFAAEIVGIVGGVVLVALGLLMLVGLHRRRRRLRRAPLRLTTARLSVLRRPIGRGRSVAFVYQEPDGSWRLARLRTTLHEWKFRRSLTGSEALEVSEWRRSVVARVPGTTLLVAGRVKRTVDAPTPDAEPQLVLHGGRAGGFAAPAGEGVWYDEWAKPPFRLALVVAPLTFVLIASVAVGDHRVGSLAAPSLYLAILLLGVAVQLAHLTVDGAGVRRRPAVGRARRIRFDEIAAVERYPTIQPMAPTLVALVLHDGTRVRLFTRRPDELVAAFRRAGTFA